MRHGSAAIRHDRAEGHVEANRAQHLDRRHPAFRRAVVGEHICQHHHAGVDSAGLHAALFVVQLLPGFLGEQRQLAPAVDAKRTLHQATRSRQAHGRVGQRSEARAPLAKAVIVAEELLLQRCNPVLLRAAGHGTKCGLGGGRRFLPIHALPQILVEPRNIDAHRTLRHATRAGSAQFAEARVHQRTGAGFPRTADAAGISFAAEGMPAHRFKVGAGVQAGAATDAVERFMQHRIFAHAAASVIDQHQVELARLAGPARRDKRGRLQGRMQDAHVGRQRLPGAAGR